jgi:hypothetical protein
MPTVSPEQLNQRDQLAYQAALREHDDQEAARLQRQINERLRVSAERQRVVAEQARKVKEEQAQRELAKKRAEDFLIEHLTPLQRETLKKNGWFVVEGGKSKQQYRIRGNSGMVANIDVLPKDRNSPIHRLCGHIPIHKVPMSDQLLAQKMMLEFAEEDFLRISNRHP